MNEDISVALAIIIVFFLVLGSTITLIGSIGLARAQNFYQRLHMPTLATSCGVGSIILASIIYSIYADHQLIVHEILLLLFLIITTPVTLMLISRASMHRDQSQEWLNQKQEYLPQSLEVELEKFKKQYEMPAVKTIRTSKKPLSVKKTASDIKTKPDKNVKTSSKKAPSNDNQKK